MHCALAGAHAGDSDALYWQPVNSGSAQAGRATGGHMHTGHTGRRSHPGCCKAAPQQCALITLWASKLQSMQTAACLGNLHYSMSTLSPSCLCLTAVRAYFRIFASIPLEHPEAAVLCRRDAWRNSRNFGHWRRCFGTARLVMSSAGHQFKANHKAVCQGLLMHPLQAHGSEGLLSCQLPSIAVFCSEKVLVQKAAAT